MFLGCGGGGTRDTVCVFCGVWGVSHAVRVREGRGGEAAAQAKISPSRHRTTGQCKGSAEAAALGLWSVPVVLLLLLLPPAACVP